MEQTRERAIFGDFQTPIELARCVAALVKRQEPKVATVVEPTCGVGGFLRATAEMLGPKPTYYGFDINPAYVETARSALYGLRSVTFHVEREDFYQMDWKTFFSRQTAPVLVIGNPPWITNAAMGAIGGANLPEKSNFQRHGGFAAKTGKANFDISEWMLIRLIESLQGIPATVAMLCKTATARKVLRHAWVNGWEANSSSLHVIDAAAHFGVSVDACLLCTHTGNTDKNRTAAVYPSLSFGDRLYTFGLAGTDLVSNIETYRTLRDLDGVEYRRWRSGVKHDAAKVMEFRREGSFFVNGFGEKCDLEPECLYPLLKSSDLANRRLRPTRYVLVTQHSVSDNTDGLRLSAPRTWEYLLAHAAQLDRRGSSIYSKRARFSVFGIGDYTFSPWKVAISGLYKTLRFQALGPWEEKPVLVDDTCYFFPCRSMAEAQFFADLLNTEAAQKFISSLVFTDAKRPVTIDVLRRIDLKKLSEHLGEAPRAVEYLASPATQSSRQTVLLFEERGQYGRKQT